MIRHYFRMIALTLGILGAFSVLQAQEAKEETSLILKSQGSFFVGGERVKQTRAELGGGLPDGHITINQMYVRYMMPPESQNRLPVVMIHGMTLTGKTWETTPDNRMGWDEYFVRKGHASYVVDQVGRGRSGFDQSRYNRVGAGVEKASVKSLMRRFSDENVWPNFRYGSLEGNPYPETQYPHEFSAEASKQSIPDLHTGLPDPNPNYKALSELAQKLDGVVLISHSQSGAYPIETALLDAKGIRGMVLVEPGHVRGTYTDAEIAKLAKIPVLVVFGDYIGKTPEGTGHTWKSALDSSNAFIARINAAGGNATMLHLPEQGIRGNSHMVMQDKNNLAVADLILKWIEKNVAAKENKTQRMEQKNKMNTLTAKEQQLAAISANTARGNLVDLKQALNAGLDAGLTVNEIKEVLTQLYAYCGFPRSLNALGTFMTVIKERGNKDAQGKLPSPLPPGKSIDFGTANQTKLIGREVKGGIYDFAPAIDEYLKAHLFGDIFGRDNLDWKTREIATVAALAAMSGTAPQLQGHIGIAKHNGVTDAQIAEILAIVTPDPRKVSPFPVGAENTGYTQYFSGKSYLAPLTKDKRLNTPVFNVTFEPGCRNNWHKHTGGQMLIAVGGVGFYQERGLAARKLLPGDVVEIAPDVEHWHGASPDSFFSHLSVECNPATNKNTWLEAVSEADYKNATEK